jgi:hydroxymethylbilane synthase
VIVPIRGNVETRLRKLDAGEVEALCLALAGLRRIDLESRVGEVLHPDLMLPAAGQGALGIQARDDDDVAEEMRILDDAATHAAVEAERAVLHRLQGGCRLPVGALATLEETMLKLDAAVVAPDGSGAVRGTRTGPSSDAAGLGRDLADELLRRGAGVMLPLEGARQ